MAKKHIPTMKDIVVEVMMRENLVCAAKRFSEIFVDSNAITPELEAQEQCKFWGTQIAQCNVPDCLETQVTLTTSTSAYEDTDVWRTDFTKFILPMVLEGNAPIVKGE